MRCNFLESDNTCQAGINVSAWKIEATDPQLKKCKSEDFTNCPRLEIFLKYTTASTTLKVKQ